MKWGQGDILLKYILLIKKQLFVKVFIQHKWKKQRGRHRFGARTRRADTKFIACHIRRLSTFPFLHRDYRERVHCIEEYTEFLRDFSFLSSPDSFTLAEIKFEILPPSSRAPAHFIILYYNNDAYTFRVTKYKFTYVYSYINIYKHTQFLSTHR